MKIERHLKEKIYYSDLYDRHTIEECRRWESKKEFQVPKSFKNDNLKKLEIRKGYMENVFIPVALYFIKGDRYINKEKTIKEWMAADEAKDKLYESAMPPANIRCLKCGSTMNLLDKDFWTGGLNKPDRVLFMFDCPNGCVPRRAFYDNGEEWKPKLNPCPKCGKDLDSEDKITKDKFITHYKCLLCGFTKTDELERTANKKEKPDPNFNTDRERFCLSEEQGVKYQLEAVNLNQMKKFVDEWEERNKDKYLYDKVEKIKKLTVMELEKLLTPILEKENYFKLDFSKPKIDRNIIINFTIQDNKSGRVEYDSRIDLQRLIKKILLDTNWRLMSDGINYRLGVLSGRLRGYESEEDLIKLVENK